MSKGPVLIELDEEPKDAPRPDTAPPVPDMQASDLPDGQAMQHVTNLMARRPSRLARFFWFVLALLLTTVLSIAAWDYGTALIARLPWLGYGVSGLAAILLLLMLIAAVRELSMIARLKRLDGLQRAAERAMLEDDLKGARKVVLDLTQLYQGRPETQWGRDRLKEHLDTQFDADAALSLGETEILRPLDKAAMVEIEAAARQVATVTALVPLALADVIAALTANLRMIRRIAVIYGGRSGTLGSWRLARAVMAHLVATGAVAVGDDLISSVAGGGLLSKLSRRFGEGLVNGALTARVGVAAMEVCRPMPFVALERPSVTGLVRRALTGVFGKD
jgi:putative membrane protein